MTDAGPGRRTPEGRGETVEGVPVLRRVPTDTDALVSIDAPEATAWFPYEGTADYYELRIEYQPDAHAVELMSLRDYLQTYRDETIGHEDFAKRIYDDLVGLLDQRWLRLSVEAPPRYGLNTTVRHQTGPKPGGCRPTPTGTDRPSSDRTPVALLSV